MAGQIKCKVEECKHNRDFICHAGSIQVMSSRTKRPTCSDETACHTFAPRT